ncbi:hypothetical protein ACIQ9Q_10650 [Streptomyces sp. NPDC094438]|uniref:hypothetical protein n=1 Tax=Streptomyces sp. NPDC094438 TaxID=3366061 RepID=UPI0037FD803A
MSFRGLQKDRARDLAAAVSVAGGALAVQGGLISSLLAQWNGQAGKLSEFPKKASWAADQAKDIRRRIGILDADPDADLLYASLSGVLDDWKEFKDFADGIKDSDAYKRYKSATESDAYKNFQDAKKTLKVTGIPTAVEASLSLYQRWQQGQNVAGARAVFELNKYFGVDADRLKLKRGEFLKELLEDQRLRNMYKEPWKWQQAVAKIGAKLRIPAVGKIPKVGEYLERPLAKIFTKAPGVGFLSEKVLLPANVVTGVKEMVLPDHAGPQGWVDRGMGGVQAAGAVAVMGGTSMGGLLFGAGTAAAAAVPVVGWVALGVAGTYFLGSMVWDRYGDDIKKGASKAWKASKNWGGKTLKKLKFW